jgi:hypothetical protein
MIMKTRTLTIRSVLSAALPLLLIWAIVPSCTKTKTVTNTVTDSVKYTPAVTPPTNPDNATDAGGVDSANLVAYWSFNNTLTEKVENLTGTGTNVVYVPGVKGQAYQGSGGAYALYSNPGTALPALQSFSIAFWMYADQPTPFPPGDTSSTPYPGLGAQGLFDLANTAGFWGNLHLDLEPRTITGGIPDPDTLLMKIELTSTATGVVWSNQFPTIELPNAVDQWTHVIITYNGASGKFTIYENGAPVSFTGAYGYSYGPFNSAITLYANDPGSATNSNNAPVLGNLQFANATKLVIGTWQMSTTPSLTSGAGAQVWASAYTGALDEMRIYNNAMTANDANSLYLLEKAGF